MKLFNYLFLLLLIGCVSIEAPKIEVIKGRYYENGQYKYTNFVLLKRGSTNGIIVTPEFYGINGQTNFYWLKKYESFNDANIGPQPATFGITDIKIN